MTIDKEAIKQRTMALVAAKPEYVQDLKVLLELDNRNSVGPTLFKEDSPTGRGFFSEEVREVNWGRLGHLISLGILIKFWESNTSAVYCLADPESVQAAIDGYEKAVKEIEETRFKPGDQVVVPDDIFDCIVGFDDIKALFRMSLKCEKPYHIMLVGPPACAKSLFLQECARIRGAIYLLGSGTSKVGLATYLIEKTPRFVLIDEVDKMNRDDYSVLLSALESGIVTEMKYGKNRSIQATFTSYAAANRDLNIPQEVRSRYEILYVPEYDRAAFLETGALVLIKREKVEAELAKYITEAVYNMGEERRDIREVVRIGRVCSDQKAVDDVIAIIKKYSRLTM